MPLDEKHKEWLIIGGSVAGIAGLFLLLRKGSPSSAPNYGQVGSTGGGSGANDAQSRLAAFNSLANLQIAEQKLKQDQANADRSYALAAGQLANQVEINRQNNDAKNRQSLLSALSKGFSDSIGALKGGERNPTPGEDRTQPIGSMFAGAGFGNLFSFLGIGKPLDERGSPVEDVASDGTVEPGGGVLRYTPPYNFFGLPTDTPYSYDDTSTPASRFDDLSARNYSELEAPSGGNDPNLGPVYGGGYLSNDYGGGFDFTAPGGISYPEGGVPPVEE